MKLPTTAKERSTVGMYTGLLLGGLTLLPAAASHSDEGADALVGIPQVEACSQRYRAIETPRPRQAADAAYRDGHASVRQNFHTTRHWGTDENVERLGTGQTGIDEPGLRVHYPAGTSSPGEEPRGGAGFYSAPPSFQGADRACLSYMVRFPADFDFVRGGKLPGLYGGEAPSGGEEVDGVSGFSMRLMWREEGEGELYPYVVGFEGESIGRGFWHFPLGQWVTIEQEVVLNDPGQDNGIARLWVDGRPVLEHQNVVFRTTPDLTIDGLMFSTFFGGTGEGWRTPRDQYVDFAAFRFYTP